MVENYLRILSEGEITVRAVLTPVKGGRYWGWHLCQTGWFWQLLPSSVYCSAVKNEVCILQ